MWSTRLIIDWPVSFPSWQQSLVNKAIKQIEMQKIILNEVEGSNSNMADVILPANAECVPQDFRIVAFASDLARKKGKEK